MIRESISNRETTSTKSVGLKPSWRLTSLIRKLRLRRSIASSTVLGPAGIGGTLDASVGTVGASDDRARIRRQPATDPIISERESDGRARTRRPRELESDVRARIRRQACAERARIRRPRARYDVRARIRRHASSNTTSEQESDVKNKRKFARDLLP